MQASAGIEHGNGPIAHGAARPALASSARQEQTGCPNAVDTSRLPAALADSPGKPPRGVAAAPVGASRDQLTKPRELPGRLRPSGGNASTTRGFPSDIRRPCHPRVGLLCEHVACTCRLMRSRVPEGTPMGGPRLFGPSEQPLGRPRALSKRSSTPRGTSSPAGSPWPQWHASSRPADKQLCECATRGFNDEGSSASKAPSATLRRVPGNFDSRLARAWPEEEKGG
jgi:hypothetical protein